MSVAAGTRLGDAWVRAIATGDENALRAVLDSSVDFRAPTPSAEWEATTADDVAAIVLGPEHPDRGCTMPYSLEVPLKTDPASTTTRWSAAGLLLEAIAARDFLRMTDCFEPAATMRALLPRGPAEFQGAAEIVDAFQLWFGGTEGFEVLDATVGDIGSRLHALWRLRVHPTPRGDERWHLIEQQAYAQAGDRIEALDLLCSGFIPDNHV